MTSARDVIRLVIEDIDAEINMLESHIDYAVDQNQNYREGKRCAMAAGMDVLAASERFDYSIGYYSGWAGECRSRCDVLRRKREYYLSLDKQYAEEGEENE